VARDKIQKEIAEKKREFNAKIREIERRAGITAEDKQRAAAQRHNRERNNAARDIGIIPKVAKAQRRDECKFDLRRYLETYHAKDFTLAWSPSHILLIESIQVAILESLQQAIIFPRGSGKTAIARRSIQWGSLYGHFRFGMLFAAEATKAKQHIDDIKKNLLKNRLLFADFPEIIFPVRCADGIANRANYQTYDGELTGLTWGGSEIIFPDIEPSREAGNAGSVIGVGTILGSASRGPLVNGFRPDFALIDDPETRKSAKSPSQVKERLSSINGDILGMAGPSKSISAVLTGTNIAKGSAVDRLLDHEDHADWNAIRVPMLKSFPSDMTLWDQWADIRRACLVDERDMTPAHDFYREHRADMDAEAHVYWQDRIKPGFESALESAMDLYYKDPETFATEYQSDPTDDEGDPTGMPARKELIAKTNRFGRYEIPAEASRIAAYIDVQGNVLYYKVMAFKGDFTGYVIDWGSYPDQKRRYFTMSEARNTIFDACPGAEYLGALEAALHALMDQLENRTYATRSGQEYSLGVGMIDAAYGTSTNTVFSTCDQRSGRLWFPSFGRGHGAKKKPFSEFKTDDQEWWGPNARMPLLEKVERNHLYFLYETNFWKSFFAGHWGIASGDPGAFTFFEGNQEMPADHYHAEKMTLVKTPDREVGEWDLKMSTLDNHLFDCGVGCCVGGVYLGATCRGLEPAKRKARRKKRRLTAQTIKAMQR